MPGTQRVFIGNIAPGCRTRDVERFFKGFGKMGEISLKNGYGFVDFDDYRDAEDAVKEMDGKDLNGDRIRVELAHTRREKERLRQTHDRRSPPRYDRGRRRNPPGRKTSFRLVVENISSRTSWQDLKDFFRSAGDITYTSAHKSRSGEGLVEFSDRRGMEYALDRLDNTELDGRKIRLMEERPPRDSRGRGRRSRSRSVGSRSASRSPRRSSRSRTRSRS